MQQSRMQERKESLLNEPTADAMMPKRSSFYVQTAKKPFIVVKNACKWIVVFIVENAQRSMQTLALEFKMTKLIIWVKQKTKMKMTLMMKSKRKIFDLTPLKTLRRLIVLSQALSKSLSMNQTIKVICLTKSPLKVSLIYSYSIESINSKKIKLSNLKDEDDLLFDGKEEVYQKKEKGSKKLNELLELEDESADSQVEEPREEEEDVEPLPEVMEAIDHEEEAKKFFNQPIFDDLDSQSSNSDAENKRDPLFVEEIEIE